MIGRELEMKTISKLAVALALGVSAGALQAQDVGPTAPGATTPDAGVTDPAGPLPGDPTPTDPVPTNPTPTLPDDAPAADPLPGTSDLPEASPDEFINDSLEPVEPSDPDESLEPDEVEPYPDADPMEEDDLGEIDPLDPDTLPEETDPMA